MLVRFPLAPVFVVLTYLVVSSSGSTHHHRHHHTPHAMTKVQQSGHHYEICVQHSMVHQSHGIHVVSWRWSELHVYIIITGFIIIAAVAKLGFHHAHFLSSKLPESCLLIILGVILGVITFNMESPHDIPIDVVTTNGTVVSHCEQGVSEMFPKFTSTLFFLILLPPIILEASYSLHDRTFSDNLGTVLLYAVVGTLFNMFIIGPILYYLAVSGMMGTSIIPSSATFNVQNLTLVQVLVFAALIVAVDPVAVLAIFQEVGVHKELYFLVFGESLLNDAVTVVLYNSMVSFSGMASRDEPVEAQHVLLAMVSFLCVSLGGLSIGVLFGLLTALITKHTDDVRVVEPLSLLLMAYLSYITAELFHFSGIIATVGCGVVQAHYAMRNISKNSYITVKYFITMASSTSDTIIFMFLGMVLVSGKHVFHTGFAMWTLVLCLVIRFIGVYFFTFLANLRRAEPVDKEEQFIMAYGGLRGAVGFSLAVMLEDSTIPSSTVRVFITTTLFIILFTVFIQGSTIKLLVSMFNIRLDSSEQKKMIDEVACSTFMNIIAGVEEIIDHHSTNVLRLKLERFDERYLQHWFIRDRSDIALSRLHDELALQDHYANLYGPAAVLHHNSVTEDRPLRLSMNADNAEQLFSPSDLSPAAGIPTHMSPALATRLRNNLVHRTSSVPPDNIFQKIPAAMYSPEEKIHRYQSGNWRSATAGVSGADPNSSDEATLFRQATLQNPFYKMHRRHDRNLINDHNQELENQLRRRRASARHFSSIASSFLVGDVPLQLQTVPGENDEVPATIRSLSGAATILLSRNRRNRAAALPASTSVDLSHLTEEAHDGDDQFSDGSDEEGSRCTEF